MARVIANGRITNAKGNFTRGDAIEGSEQDLKPLVDTGAAHWDDGNPLDAVDMTERAGEIALSAGLTPEDFAGLEPSGVTGFTVADVEAILDGREG